MIGSPVEAAKGGGTVDVVIGAVGGGDMAAIGSIVGTVVSGLKVGRRIGELVVRWGASGTPVVNTVVGSLVGKFVGSVDSSSGVDVVGRAMGD